MADIRYLELLSPAKSYEQGAAAIDHGADAVYVGAPSFGARAAAGNSIEDIELLVGHAHRFHAKVFVTVNTLLFDDEVEAAVRMIWRLYEIGVDAVIIQDMGLLECNLPPIALHASTQTHNIDVERVKFLEQVGFKRVILAREASLERMRAIREATNVELEAFVQGALCVCYSGQCYLSQFLNERSGNRGQCGQPCRSAYDLYSGSGKLLRKDEHLLSLKDFSASRHIEQMVEAGITSFKIEGRLKDLSYVKNVTAYYRRLLDGLMEGRKDWRSASIGKTEFFFVPDLERTFNRGFTDYFLERRQKMASLSTQKSIGKQVGRVEKCDGNTIIVVSAELFVPGDGLCYFNGKGELEGFLVNRAEGNRLWPNHALRQIALGTALWRNNDSAFEKKLQGKSAERKIPVDIILAETSEGLALVMKGPLGAEGKAETICEKTLARDIKRAEEQTVRQISKLGDTIFAAQSVTIETKEVYFVPMSVLNELRRMAANRLEERLVEMARPDDVPLERNEAPYYEQELSYRANVVNSRSAAFYQRHGVTSIEEGLEKTKDYAGKALMTTKYCLRYELGQCTKNCNQKDWKGNLFLKNNNNWFLVQCNCKECEMQLFHAKEGPFDG